MTGATNPLPAAAADVPTDVAPDAIEVVKSRSPEGFAFSVKILASGQIYRFEPIRYPREPRFWCLSVRRCLGNGVIDPDERAWISETLLTREELAAATQEVRADVSAWLAQESHKKLRRWLFSGRPTVGAGSATRPAKA